MKVIEKEGYRYFYWPDGSVVCTRVVDNKIIAARDTKTGLGKDICFPILDRKPTI